MCETNLSVVCALGEDLSAGTGGSSLDRTAGGVGGVGVRRFAFAVGVPGGEGNFGLDEDEDEDGLLVGVAPLGGVAGGGVAPLEEREEAEEQEEAERRWGFLGGRSGGGRSSVA